MQATAKMVASLSLRHLKAARCVADYGNLTRAANALNRTQPAITKSLHELETRLGHLLFDRSPRGMTLTAQGDVFINRVREAESQFTAAGKIYLKSVGRISNVHANPVFSMDISQKRLAAFIALYETGNVAAAATRVCLTPAAIYASVRQLEKLLETPLFEYDRAQIRRSDFCEVLATHVKLAFSLLRHGLEEIASLDGATQGGVVIGSLPYARTLLIPRSIHRLLEQHPQLQISTKEGPYDTLEVSLRNGDIDLIVGATRRPHKSSTLRIKNLFKDKLAIIARPNHPLVGVKRVSLKQLLLYGWILPPANTPARQLFDQFLAAQSRVLPGRVIETSSLSVIRGLLFDSDRVALLSKHQVYYEEQAEMLVTLAIDLQATFRPIGITTRSNTTPSPAARLMAEFLTATASELQV